MKSKPLTPTPINWNTLLTPPLNIPITFQIVAIDPSGNVKQGNGHLGLALATIRDHQLYLEQVKTLELSKISLKDALAIICEQWISYADHVIIENYLDYQNPATRMREPETYYVVRYLVDYCQTQGIPYTTPIASQHKTRFSDHILKAHNVNLRKLGTRHSRDAVRMILFWFMFKNDAK